MNALTRKDRWMMFWMRFLLAFKGLLLKCRFEVIKAQAHWLNLEIRDLDKSYFKKRLADICRQDSTMRMASGSGTGEGQQLFFYTFQIVTYGNNLERSRSANFPPEWYYLLRGPEPKGLEVTKGELWQIQGTNRGELQDCYLVNTLNARGEQIAIFVTMSELDKRVGGRSLEFGDCIRASVGPEGLMQYEVLDTVEMTEMWPGTAEFLERPGVEEGLREYLSPDHAQ